MLAVAFNARALSPQEFGLLTLLQASTLALSGLLTIGTQQPVIQLGSAALRENDYQRLGQIIGLGLSYDIAAALVALSAGFSIIFLAGSLLGIGTDQRALACIVAGALLFMGYLSSNGIFRLLNRFDLLSYIQAGTGAVMLFGSALLYFLEARLSAYVWTWAAVTAAGVQVQLWTALYLMRKRGVRVSFAYRGMSPDDKRQFLSYGWTTWGLSVIEAMRTQGDTLMVGAFVSVEAVGLYNVAKQLAGVLRKLSSIYTSATFPEIAHLAARKDIAGARHLRGRMIWIGLAAGAFAVGLMMLLGDHLLELAFGEPFRAAYTTLILLMLASALQLVSHTLSVYVQVFVSPAALFFIYFIALAVYIVAVPLGLTLLSVEGAALGQITFCLGVILLSHRALENSPLGRN